MDRAQDYNQVVVCSKISGTSFGQKTAYIKGEMVNGSAFELMSLMLIIRN